MVVVLAVESWPYQPVVRLLVAATLGAAVGLEREYHGRAAGLRTHLLVTLGAALVMVVSLHFAEAFGTGAGGGNITVDPARLAYGVMGGIGFIGAGAIIQYGAGVRGLTTAASLWCSAAIGLAAGFGLYALAGTTTATVLFALAVLDFVERRIPGRVVKKIKLVVAGCGEDALGRYRKLLAQDGVKIVDSRATIDYQADQCRLTFHVSANAERLYAALGRLRGAPGILRLTVE